MNIFFSCLLIGVGLSMDAFSLALSYGTGGLGIYRQILLSVIVGVFHFFMPLLGCLFGSLIGKYIVLSSHIVIGVIFFIIGIDMIYSARRKQEESLSIGNIFEYVIFGFTVSIDSFTTGIGVSLIMSHYLFASFIFMLCSGFFTFLGLNIGDRFYHRYGRYATILGGLIMIFMAVIYLL